MPKLVRFDWAIKYLLRNKANFDVLEGFLSELLKTQIKIESLLESESNKQHGEDKFNRVDLLVRTAEGEHIIIEVQCSSQWDYLSRVLYGSSKMVCEHLREGDEYAVVPKVISVSIVFFDLGQGKDYLYHGVTTFKGLHYHDTLTLNSQERQMYGQLDPPYRQSPESIFPEYYIIKVSAFQERVKDKFDEWVYFLKHGKIEANFLAQGIQSAAKKLDMLHLTEQERRAYQYYQEGLHDEASLMAQIKFEKAQIRAESLAEGSKQAQLQIARSLKQAGLSDTDIVAHTGLSLEEVKHL